MKSIEQDIQDSADSKIAEVLFAYKTHQEDSKRRGRITGAKEKKYEGQPNGRPHQLLMGQRWLAQRGFLG